METDVVGGGRRKLEREGKGEKEDERANCCGNDGTFEQLDQNYRITNSTITFHSSVTRNRKRYEN